MEKIVALSRADYEDVFALSQFAFQYTLSEDELVKKAREADRHDIWGYHIDGKLAGKLHVIPLEVMIQGKKIPMGGIASVATWPEYRRSGVAKKLLHHAIVKMKEKGQILSYLHPFSARFYRNYGWEYAISRRHDTIPIEQLKYPWDGKGYVRRTTDDSEILNDIYDAYAQKFHGMLVRDPLWWQQRVLTDKEMNIALAYNDNDEREGYIIYKVRDQVLIVQELAYKTNNGRNLLYEFIGNHDSMANTVKWVVPQNNIVPFIVHKPFFEQVERPYCMVRIVDVESFLKQFPYTNHDGVITLSVEDEFFPENTSVYEVKVADQKATSIKKVNQTDDAIHCKVQYLASIFLGYKRVTELYEEELITGSKEAVRELEKMIPVKQTFLSDFF